MIITHIVMFKFLTGATEAEAAAAVGIYIPTFRPRRRK